MYLLLAASVLLQDKTAEETFKKIEEQFEKAKTISVRLKIKVEEEHTSVVFLAGEGNKFRIEESQVDGKRLTITIFDGKTARSFFKEQGKVSKDESFIPQKTY